MKKIKAKAAASATTKEEEKAISAIREQYASLSNVLYEAFEQGAVGKGHERHADPLPFEQQDLVRDAIYCGQAGPVCQIRKKAKESLRLTPGAARRELLGVIVIAAGAIIALDHKEA